MATMDEARRVLVGAEMALRKLIERGLKEQRYEDVSEVARLADALAKVLMLHSPAAKRAVLAEVQRVSESRGTARTSRPRARSAQGAFPRFERDAGNLVKIGWSKKNRSAYEHRAPRETILAFVRHLKATVGDGKPFTVEELMPVPDFAYGGEVPAYRVYLAMAWLRHAGAIEKRGRNDYVLVAGAASDESVERMWANLPVRKESV